MKKWSLLVLISALMLVMAACGQKDAEEQKTGSSNEKAEEITIEHEYGKATVKKNPEKTVVFDFGVLDTLDELGIEVTGVPQANVPKYLEKYAGKEYTNVGSLKEPDFEAIHELKPDVIFISGRQAEMYEEFAKIAPTVFVGIDYSNYMDSFKKNMNTIAEIYGKESEMKTKLEEVDGRIADVKSKTEGIDQKALVVLGSEGKVSAYGPSSRFGLIHDVFGFKAADENIEESTHGQNITFEYILKTNPDILFVIDRDAALDSNASVKAAVENELVKKTNAYKEGKIIYLDAGYWYLSGGGLQSLEAMIESMEGAL
ncbi:MAG TPA: siderophore ABC transporter substrate-binding protein [Bacillaceae bacterium]